MQQPVNKDYLYNYQDSKIFTMIDNYIYLYHTDTLIVLPTFPDSIADATNANFNVSTLLSRSAPIYSYQNSGPRSFAVTLNLHRDMMNQINLTNTHLNAPELFGEDAENDYVDVLINQLRAAVLPRYAAASKMVDPPIIAVRFGNDIFCKGVVNGGLTVNYSGPILRTNKYAQVSIDFSISEIDPYDAETVMTVGGYRGLSTDLERRLWKSSTGSSGIITTPSISSARG